MAYEENSSHAFTQSNHAPFQCLIPSQIGSTKKKAREEQKKKENFRFIYPPEDFRCQPNDFNGGVRGAVEYAETHSQAINEPYDIVLL